MVSRIPLINLSQVGITPSKSLLMKTLFIYRLIFVFRSGSNRSNGAVFGMNRRLVNSNVPSDLLCKVANGSSKAPKVEL